jgi:hypothetical protein
MPDVPTLEKRVATLENELAEIKLQIAAESRQSWFAHVAGSFKDEPDFDEVLRLGREVRQSDPPASPA